MPKNDESYGDVTQVNAVLKSRIRKARGGEIGSQAAGEKAFIARCIILRVLNSIASVSQDPRDLKDAAGARQSFEEFTLP